MKLTNVVAAAAAPADTAAAAAEPSYKLIDLGCAKRSEKRAHKRSIGETGTWSTQFNGSWREAAPEQVLLKLREQLGELVDHLRDL